MAGEVSIVADKPANPQDYLPFLAAPNKASTSALGCSLDLIVALAAKGFVILTGQSGTGKSKSAIELGQGLDGLAEYDSEVRGSSYEMVAVGADWTDERPILGYKNPFGSPRKTTAGETTHDSYEIPDGLRLLIRAAAPSASSLPCLLVLDEMNLSHVERYFSPFLSRIEANRSSGPDAAIPLLAAEKFALVAEVLKASEPNSCETTAAQELLGEAKGLPMPPNLMIVGTVNVDETTYMFSPKVLDRAHVLELHSAQPNDYFQNKAAVEATVPPQVALSLLTWAIATRKDGLFDERPEAIAKAAKELLPGLEGKVQTIFDTTRVLLDGAYTLLDPVGFGFGYRAINEVCSYLLSWIKARTLIAKGSESPLEGWQEAVDKVFLQKILPKIHGNRRQFGDSLSALDAFLAGGDENSKPPAKYKLGIGGPIAISAARKLPLENGMRRSRAKLSSMQNQLQATGYATFIR